MKTILNVFIVWTASEISAAQYVDYLDAEALASGTSWTDFLEYFGKHYDTEEEKNMRKAAFKINSRSIERHNERYNQNLTTYMREVNEFTDWSREELRKLDGFKKRYTMAFDCEKKTFDMTGMTFPDSLDWVDQGAVTPVKYQGKCASDYAFSAIGSLESLMHIKKGKVLHSLSPQNLVDCSYGYGNKGCNGGSPISAFQYVEKNRGIDNEESYPYRGVGGRCMFNDSEKATEGGIEGCYSLPEGDESMLKAALVAEGPISVGVAIASDIYFYKSGVYDNPRCDAAHQLHAMLLVGYGVDAGTGLEYWKLKNSWGTGWGETGYMRILKNGHNFCKITSTAVYPKI